MAMTKREFQLACFQAADQIQRDGLCKSGSYGTNDGPKCAIGALRYVVSGNVDKWLPVDETMVDKAFKAARPRTKRTNIVGFNDAGRTRKHDVVALLRDMSQVSI